MNLGESIPKYIRWFSINKNGWITGEAIIACILFPNTWFQNTTVVYYTWQINFIFQVQRSKPYQLTISVNRFSTLVYNLPQKQIKLFSTSSFVFKTFFLNPFFRNLVQIWRARLKLENNILFFDVILEKKKYCTKNCVFLRVKSFNLTLVSI